MSAVRTTKIVASAGLAETKDEVPAIRKSDLRYEPAPANAATVPQLQACEEAADAAHPGGGEVSDAAGELDVEVTDAKVTRGTSTASAYASQHSRVELRVSGLALCGSGRRRVDRFGVYALSGCGGARRLSRRRWGADASCRRGTDERGHHQIG